jgi:hypothetical protein
MGGQQYQTGTANQTMTPPGMSWLQGLAGAGALGYGAYQSGLFGGGQTNPTPIAQGITDPSQQARGGRIYPHFADGGDVPDDNLKNIDLGPDQFSRQEDEALAPVLSDRGYVPAEDTQIKMPDSMPKPMAPMQTQQSGSGSSGGSTLGTIASIAGTAAKIIPMFLKDGGRAYDDGGTVPMQQPLGGGAPGANSYPTPAMLGRPIAQGALPQQAQMQSPNVFYGRPLPNMLPPSPVTGQQAGQNMYEMARQALQQQQLGQALSSFRNRASSQDDDVSVSSHEYARGGYADGGDTDDSPYPDALPGILGPIGLKGDRLDSGQARSFDDRFPSEWGEQGPTAIDRSPLANAPLATYPAPDRTLKGSRPDVGITPTPTPDQISAARDAIRAGVPTPPPTDVSDTRRTGPYPAPPGGAGGFDPGTASPSDILNLNNYKDQVAQRPTVRGLMNNGDFWMRAGLNILAANPAKGPIGAIASGAAGTVGNYDQWSKEDLSSKQKAQELAGKLMEHAQKYTRMTPAERERLDIEHERLQQGHYQAVNYTDAQGRLNVGRFNTKTGQIVDSEGSPVNPSRIYGRSSRVESGDITPQQMSIIIDRYRKNHPQAIGMDDTAVRDLALQEINAQKQGATQAPPRPQGMSDADIIGQARTAVQNDPAKRDAVLQRLKAWGIDTSGM